MALNINNSINKILNNNISKHNVNAGKGGDYFSSGGLKKPFPNTLQNAKKYVIDGKPVYYCGNKHNAPSPKLVKNVYATIPDDKKAPVVFQTKRQYLKEYIRNQEHINNVKFSKKEKQQYIKRELKEMKPVVSRFTTYHNEYMEPRTVFFTDDSYNKHPKNFKMSAYHEYWHEKTEGFPAQDNEIAAENYAKDKVSYDRFNPYKVLDIWKQPHNNISFKNENIVCRCRAIRAKGSKCVYCGAQDESKNREWQGDIQKQTVDNKNYRQVLATNKNSQLVVMSLKPQQDIGTEKHKNVDQFIRVESGKGQAILDNKHKYNLKDGTAVVVPAGHYHNIVNTSKTEPLKLYTVYSPFNHPVNTIQKDKLAKDRDKQLKLNESLARDVINKATSGDINLQEEAFEITWPKNLVRKKIETSDDKNRIVWKKQPGMYYIDMPPIKFLEQAPPIHITPKSGMYGEEWGNETQTVQDFADDIQNPNKVIYVDAPYVYGTEHEGRHRSYGALLAGLTSIPVGAYSPSNYTSEDIAEAFIKKLNDKGYHVSNSYANEWRQRFKTGSPEQRMDDKTIKIYLEVLQEKGLDTSNFMKGEIQ